MKITEALNYMKTIINNGKKNNNSTRTVRKGLFDYLGTLIGEGVISDEDCHVLSGVVKQIGAIMRSEITVDEAFVKSMCNVQETPYVPLNTSKSIKDEKTVSKEEGIPLVPPYPWDVSQVSDGSCGRFQEARRHAAQEKMRERLLRGCDGIPFKCRH